jgi:hypothetical protein
VDDLPWIEDDEEIDAELASVLVEVSDVEKASERGFTGRVRWLLVRGRKLRRRCLALCGFGRERL